jgi:hypothetical protein
VQTDTPVIARWGVPGQEHVTAYPYGAQLSLYAPPGDTWITLHAVGDGTLSGAARFTSLPVETVGEGVGPERLLAGGSARAFAFTLDQTRQVGLGVRAIPDLVQAQLLDSGGHSRGEGVVQFKELPAGTYLLLVQVPAATVPVRVHPVTLGLTPGTPGPPAELIQRFVAAGSEDGLISSTEQPTPTPAADESPSSTSQDESSDTEPAEAEEGAEGEQAPDDGEQPADEGQAGARE